MKKAFWIVLTISFLFLIPITVQAQDQSGSISGTVYRDLNLNGLCASEDEPKVAANIPLELVSDDAGELIRISSAADGTHAFTTDTLGLWSVTILPGQGWRVTSQQTLEVVLSIDNPDATNIDFCIIEIDQTGGGGGTTLPESGFIVSTPLLLAAAIGFILVTIGTIMLLVGRLTRT